MGGESGDVFGSFPRDRQLALAWGTAAKLVSGAPDTGERRLLGLYGAMAGMGAVALMLGLWLAGSA